MNRKLLIISGEKSGLDSILPALKLLDPNLQKNINLIAHNYSSVPDSLKSNIQIPSFSGLGINLDILYKYLRTFTDILEFIKKNRFTDILFIDNPDFNLLIARSISTQKNINLHYYIIPQFWAWREYRIKYLKKFFKKIYVIFPFEKELLAKHNIRAKFVGHPKLEEVTSLPPKQEILKSLGLKKNQKIISLFPGTRKSTLERHFEIFKDSALLLAEKLPDYKIIISDICTEKNLSKGKLTFSPLTAGEILKVSEFAIISSGSTTMEATFLNIPFIGVYKPDLLTYAFGNLLVKSNSTLMPNILLGERFTPEIVSPYLSKDDIVKTTMNILQNREQMLVIKNKLSSISQMFYGYKTSEIMSKEIESILIND